MTFRATYWKTGLAAVLATATVAGTTLSGVSEAEAGHRRGHGAAVAAGIIGGIAAGALIAGAARPAYGGSVYYDEPSYGYRPVRSYRTYDYYDEPAQDCHWERRRVRLDPWTYTVRRVQVCY